MTVTPTEFESQINLGIGLSLSARMIRPGEDRKERADFLNAKRNEAFVRTEYFGQSQPDECD